MTEEGIWSVVARLRRAFPRQADVLALCEAYERLAVEVGAKPKSTPKTRAQIQKDYRARKKRMGNEMVSVKPTGELGCSSTTATSASQPDIYKGVSDKQAVIKDLQNLITGIEGGHRKTQIVDDDDEMKPF